MARIFCGEAGKTAVKLLQQSHKFITAQVGIAQNFAQQTAPHILPWMIWHGHDTAVWMPQPNVAPFLPHAFKASLMKRRHNLTGRKKW